MSCLCFLCQAWTSSWNSRAGLQRQQCRGAVIQGNFILFIPISWLCLSGRVRTSGSFCSTEKWSSGPGREGWPEHLRVPSGRNQRQSPQVLYEGHHSFDLRRVSISGYSSFSHEFLYQTGGSKPSLLVSLKFWFTESLFILYRHLGLQVEADKDKKWRSCLTLYQVTRLFFQAWVCLLSSVDILNFATLIYNQSWPTVCLYQHCGSIEGPGELCLKAGDIVTMVEPVDSEWYRGTCRGSTGFFPINYVKVLVSSTLF